MGTFIVLKYASRMLPMMAVVADYLSKSSLDSLLLTTTDAHSSEYIGECDLVLQAITGFTGSFGMALVNKDGGHVYTDPRYHLQAPHELHTGFTLVKTMDEFIQVFTNGSSVGVDTRNVSQKTFQKLSEKLKDVKFVPDLNFVDAIWSNRPLRVFHEVEDVESLFIGPYIDDRIRSVVTVPERFEKANVTGSYRKEKLQDILGVVGSNTVVITALDEIAWILNMRGSDIPFNPVFYSFLIISKNKTVLYTNANIDIDGFFVAETARKTDHMNQNQEPIAQTGNGKGNGSETTTIQTDKTLEASGSVANSNESTVDSHDQKGCNLFETRIYIKSYEGFYDDLRHLSGTVHVSPSASVFVRSVLSHCDVKDFEHVRESKSIKNETEILGEKIAHLYDAIALVKLFDAVELRMGVNIEDSHVNDLVLKDNGLKGMESSQESCLVSESTTPENFTPNPDICSNTRNLRDETSSLSEKDIDTMLSNLKNKFAAFRGPSFATIAGSGPNGAIIHHSASQRKLQRNELLLTDTGSQYSFGTTDISRTISLGIPTENQRKDFTTVLKGQIAGMSQIISKNTPASAIDTITRSSIWQTKNDYAHATGHGVGHFSNVHEDPPSISIHGKPIKPGQIFSIEPGIYRENEYGIRIEDLVLAKQDGDWIFFENLTLTPLQLKMINVKLLTPPEKVFLNAFNRKVRSILTNFIKEGELGYRFLMENTECL